MPPNPYEDLLAKISSDKSSPEQEDPDLLNESITSGTGSPPTADGFITIFYKSRELEHKDRIYLMQRYFAWSIYGLIFFWLLTVLVLITLSSIQTTSNCTWPVNCIFLGGIGVGWGIFAGLAYAIMDDNKKRESSTSSEQYVIDLENYYKKLLKCLVMGGFSFGTIGAIVGIIFCSCGFSHTISSFSMSEKVLITLISSTTAGVLGIFACVMKWLFPSQAEKKEKH